MAAKPTGTSNIPTGNDLVIIPSNGTRLSRDYWGHIKARRVIGKFQKGVKAKKTNLVHKCVLIWPPNQPEYPIFPPNMT